VIRCTKKYKKKTSKKEAGSSGVMAPRLGRRPFRFIFHVLGHVLILQKGKEKDKEEKI
jgi:hypothetical protein